MNAPATQPRNPADIRNVILTGHSGAGKTTLAERLLFTAGEIPRMGSVAEGTTVSDWREIERQHGHSLYVTLLHLTHEGHEVNMIDAPGTPDFIGHAIAAFPAVETVVVVIDAHRGIEPVTRRMMQVAQARRLPRMIVINKIDDEQADPEGVLASVVEEFGPECLPVNLPTPDRGGVVKVFDEEGQGPTLFSSEEAAHRRIVEQIVEMQDDLMTQYLEEGDDHNLDRKRVHDAFEAALRDGHLVPVCFCSGKTGAGAEHLLHVIASLLPSPEEGNPRPFYKMAEGVEVEYRPEPSGDRPVLAHVFSVSADRHMGKLGIFRVHQGTVRTRGELIVDDQKKPIRVGHLAKRQGREHEEVEALGPGDIGSVGKIEEIHYDATLHEDHELDSVHLRPLPLPRPMFGLAVAIKSHADEAKFSSAMHRLTAEDPCLVMERIAATKETVIRGLGELHLRVVLDRLREEYGLEVLTSTPRVAYKETVRGTAEGHHRHKKQTGGAGQFGEVHLRVGPIGNGEGGGFEFVNATVGGSIPRQFMPAIEKGVRQVLLDGAVAGYPMTGIRVEVLDGKHHPVDSKEIAFITAGRRAFIDAVRRAGPVLLEPFVTLEITTPSSHMGDIAGAVSAKRGRVQETRLLPGERCVVVAQAPQGELGSFVTELKSLTAGQGSYTMDYSHDEPTPPQVQREVIAAFTGHAEED